MMNAARGATSTWREAGMAGPMEGVKVVELAVWVAGPSAAAILCDWGADVVKIEPPEGDPFRGLASMLGGAGSPPPFQLDNRGKRSLALDLRTDEGRAIALRLIDEADVFISNLRPGALQRLGLDHEALLARNPRLIYGHVSGYGIDSADADRAAYDVGAFWSRAGVAAILTSPGAPLPLQRGGMGDHTAGSQTAGAIAAALYRREKTGQGQLVTGSLARTGVYMLGWDLNTALSGAVPLPAERDIFPNPLILNYQVKGGRWIWLLMLQGDRHWPDFCRAVGHKEWMQDPRFTTIVNRMQNATALIREIEAVLAEKTMEEWAPILDREDVWWAPVQSLSEVLADPVLAEAGAWVDVPTGGGGTIKMVASPIDFHGTPWEPRAAVPEYGQHTEEVLLELGYDWEGIVKLKEAGVIP
jgi:crotonobetainyl-CoA:carnitine CoA-transferase CaiB-like acyl-CoA transferase